MCCRNLLDPRSRTSMKQLLNFFLVASAVGALAVPGLATPQ